jgi:hypothetical protein
VPVCVRFTDGLPVADTLTTRSAAQAEMLDIANRQRWLLHTEFW